MIHITYFIILKEYNINEKAYPYGKTPKLGAIAVWGGYGNNPYGHVAVVEEINDSIITFSKSQYSGKVFNTFKIKYKFVE
ncbi:CHAP domain-containing protein [uncultured Clostridium sp.]|uniref:CHAP domain-containing protein n=1 Tax=uncultured Clostridium sp. TaxID=59620 RepID=UPI0028EDE1B3|nr:CHAP domain-containing protein [uncultured Clostridium sp.]